MAGSILVAATEAVRQALAAQAFALSDGRTIVLDPQRSYADWDLPLEDLGVLHCDVVPVASPFLAMETRGSLLWKPEVDVVLRKRLDPYQQDTDGHTLLAEVDAHVELFERVAASLVARRLAGAEEIAWESTEVLAAVKPSHLRKFRQYTGILRVTFSATQLL
jgi:hypothetical protein